MIIAFAAAAAALAAAAPAAWPEGATRDAFVCRALEASKAGNSQAAAQAFEQAALAPSANQFDKARLLAAAGNMWIAAKQPGKAALALDKALAGTALQAEQRGEALLDRARAAEAQSDLLTARARVEQAKQTISADPFLWYFSAALAIREGNVAAARTAIGRALSLAPDDPTLLFEAGHVAHLAGDIPGARVYWTRAAAVDINGKSGRAAREALALLDRPAAPAK
jgi:tetratricopeptide (TPR) repeat protein